jgi:hypothetical protein
MKPRRERNHSDFEEQPGMAEMQPTTVPFEVDSPSVFNYFRNVVGLEEGCSRIRLWQDQAVKPHLLLGVQYPRCN